MERLTTGLLRIEEIIFMVFLCPHARHPTSPIWRQAPGEGRNEDASSGGRRLDHGMVTERGRNLGFSNPLAIAACSSLTAPRSNLPLQGMVGHPCQSGSIREKPSTHTHNVRPREPGEAEEENQQEIQPWKRTRCPQGATVPAQKALCSPRFSQALFYCTAVQLLT